jgi:hypothetical protein
MTSSYFHTMCLRLLLCPGINKTLQREALPRMLLCSLEPRKAIAGKVALATGLGHAKT